MKLTNKGKKLAALTGVVTAGYATLTGISFFISHPSAQHIETARQMSAGPEEAEFSRLMNSAESTWTMNSQMILGIALFALYVIAIYLIYKYIRQRRLTANAGGITTAIFAFASTVALLVSLAIDAAFNMQPVMFESPVALISLSVFSLLASFVITFIIVLIVEKIYDRKHGFAIE